MNDDILLKEIAKIASGDRARDRDARWEAICEGKEDGGDNAALDDDLRIAIGMDLTRPLDDASLKAIAEASLRELQGGSSLRGESAAGGAAAKAAVVIPLRRRVLPGLGVALAGFAAAAALALWLNAPSVEGIADYRVASLSGDTTMRSGDTDTRGGTLALSSGGTFEIVIRPDTPVEQSIEAQAFIVREGRAKVLSVTPDMSDQGAVRLRGRVQGAAFPKGPFEIVVIIGRAGTIPADVAEDLGTVAKPEGAWQVLRIPAFRSD